MFLLAGEILSRTARRLPKKIALLCGARAIPYAVLDHDANRFARALLANGVGKADVLAIMAPNVAEYAVAFFGAARAGSIVANLNVRSTAMEVAGILTQTESRAVAVAAPHLDTVLEARRARPTLRRIVVIGKVSGEKDPDIIPFEAFVQGQPSTPPNVAVDEDDPLSLTFTGGTTGLPKGALVSHRARGLSALAAMAHLDLREEDRAVMATPLFHAAGLLVWFFGAVMAGATSLLLPKWDPELFMSLVAEREATIALLVPTQLSDLLNHPSFDRKKLATIRTMNHAGAPMPVRLAERLMDALPHIQFIDHYGTSETGPITARPPSSLPEKIASVGHAVFNVEVEVRSPDGRACPPGEVGEVVTRGEHLLAGYFKDPETTQALYKSGDEWLWTGDLGYMDEDGYLYLVDRSKELIIAGGENLFPKEIENALYQHPAVLECAVFGVPDERLGEVPAAHVVLRLGMTATEDELVALCLTRVARHKRPRFVKFVDALPKTPVGKIQKHVIREAYWQGRERRI